MNKKEIKPCKGSRFISNLSEISSYYNARKTVTIITNISRLVGILEIYFQTFLYYKKNSPGKFLVNIDGRLYEAKVNGHNETGRPISFDLEEIFEQLVQDVLSDLARHFDLEVFYSGVQVLNSALSSAAVPVKYKICIINAENKLSENRWHTFTRQLSEKLALDSIDMRRKLIFQLLRSPDKSIMDNPHAAEIILELHSAYELYFKSLLRVHISKNHFSDITTSILKELETALQTENHKWINTSRIVNFLLMQLVLANNLFQLDRKDRIREIIDKYSTYVGESDLALIFTNLNFDPEISELSKFSMEILEPDFSNEDLDKIKTLISFVVPYETESKTATCELQGAARIDFLRIDNLFEDPIYSFLESSELNINGMPLAFLSDSIGNLNRSTLIHIAINDFIHPDFEVDGKATIPLNFDMEEARHGGRYFPHKDIILEALFALYDQESYPFHIEKKDLNSNLISNYLVSYFNQDEKLIHHKVFAVTNFDSYFRAKNKFTENFNRLYIEEETSDLRDFIFETQINSRNSFLEFCYKLLLLTLKKSIEFGGLHKAFWTEVIGENVPISEQSAQLIIFNHLRFLAEIKGIRMSREVMASDGSLDFHFSYNKNDALMNVCVELKNAHHQNLKHGIEAQLPLYIEDIGCREGIFLVLWYKSDKFPEPKKFQDITDIEKFLLKNAPAKYRIKPLVIDCTTKMSPSKPAANRRLRLE